MTSPDALVRSGTASGVTTLTLDSPHNRNALSTRLMTELVEALAAAVADDAVRVVVLTHTGPVFCSGADLKESAQAYATGTLPAGMPETCTRLPLAAASRPTTRPMRTIQSALWTRSA